jgi:hypothetical protein
MNRTIYAIEMRSLRQCVEHLRLIRLDELSATAVELGTAADVALIEGIRGCLSTLPTTHP